MTGIAIGHRGGVVAPFQKCPRRRSRWLTRRVGGPRRPDQVMDMVARDADAEQNEVL
jgi:hypothetical protein